MAINAYTGWPGSGKSYEVVTAVILPALQKGRRVVTNIYGLQFDEIAAYLVEQGADKNKLGSVVLVKNEDILTPRFFCHDGKTDDTIVQPGDLVCIDEARRFWGAGSKFLPGHEIFFREHRHYVHPETHESCDLVLVTQDISDLDRKLKVIIEMNCHMVKAKKIGLKNTYRVELSEGARTTRNKPYQTIVKKYNKEFFKFYSSYDGKGGNEQAIDKRQNMLKGSLFRVVLPLLLLLLGISVYFVWGFFHPKPAAAKVDKNGKTDKAAPSSGSDPAPHSASGVSDTWRISGYMLRAGVVLVVLQDGAGRLRYVYNPPNLRLVGQDIGVVLDGDSFTPYSGPAAESKGLLK
jgi:zona occludens toxin